jgi:hypothetical protein
MLRRGCGSVGRRVVDRCCASVAHMPLAAELVVDGRVLQALALSPDGKWVAYYGETLPRGSQATDCPLWTVMG